MKKTVYLFLCILMLASLTLSVWAKDDAAVNYQLGLSVAPESADGYSVGETVKITVSVKDILESAPDIYGIGGTLHYDAYLLTFKSVSFASAFSGTTYNLSADGTLSFSFLCGSKGGELAGKSVNAEFTFCTVTFVTRQEGTARTFLSDFIITNRDASARLISASDVGLDVKIGSGETVMNGEVLQNAIADAKENLAAATVGSADGLVYPAFAVSEEAYAEYSAAIASAEAVLLASAKSAELEAALRALVAAGEVFEAAKVYGRRPSGGSPTVSSSDTETVEVVAIAGANGRIRAGYEKQNARKGTSVSIFAEPDEGFEVEKFVVNGVEIRTNESVYTIESVTHATKVEVFFIQKPRFEDVPRGSWYFDSVEKIAEIGLFAGTSETEFSPDAEMTRAMLVTVLHRLDGKPQTESTKTFRDVPAGQWYSEAVAWASANGIVNGYTENTFGTNDAITRQDMVTILYRYLQYKKITPEGAKSIDAFADAADVSAYAVDAVCWAYGTELVKGTSDTTLSPKTNTTRAQVATVIFRYIENIAK